MKNTTKRAIGAAALTALVLALATACQNSGPTPPDPTPPDPKPTSTGAVVTGFVEDAQTHVGIPGLVVHWIAADGGDHPATTGDDAHYRIVLPDGRYQVTSGRDDIALVDPEHTDVQNPSVTVSGGGGTMDLDVEATGPAPTPDPPTPDPPAPQDSSTTVSGHVYDPSGNPVAGATVEFREAACPDCMPQPWTTTDANGYYSIDLDAGVYNAECPSGSYCEAKGSGGGPYPVTVPPAQTVDFVETP